MHSTPGPRRQLACAQFVAAIAIAASSAAVAEAGEGGRLYGAADRGSSNVGQRIYGAVPPGEPSYATSFAAANGLSSYGTNLTLANRRRFVSYFSPRGTYGRYYGFYGPWYGYPYPYGYPYGYYGYYYPYGYAAFRPGQWIGGPYPYPYVGLYRGYYPPYYGSWSGCGGGVYFAGYGGGYYW